MFYSKSDILRLEVFIIDEHPPDSEFVREHAEHSAPELDFQRIDDLPAGRKPGKKLIDFFLAAAIHIQRHIDSLNKAARTRHIGAH